MNWTQAIVLCVALKILLIQAYHSTDFEVHRNWLRITHTLPLSEWYYDTLSEWTLDYPPFFAHFEHVLSFFARFVDPKMLQHIVGYDSLATVIFQRATVIVTEAVFFCAIKNHFDNFQSAGGRVQAVVLTFAQFGFVLVDNIHFQYNAFMQGVLIYAITAMMQRKYVRAAILFSVTLNFKHIFLYVAPAFFFHLLKNYCFVEKSAGNKRVLSVTNFAKLGAAVLSVFALSFGPFFVANPDSIRQIFSRMFPFQRGLVHAYWAPNFWALYCAADRVLAFLLRRSGLSIAPALDLPNVQASSIVSGLVQETKFDVLPQVTPFITILLILLASVPLWIKILRARDERLFPLHCAYQALIFFMFGFHVHEKAILIFLNLYQIYAFQEGGERVGKCQVVYSFIAGASLMPLLPEVGETIAKVCLFAVYHAFLYMQIGRDARAYSFAQKATVCALSGVIFFGEFLHPSISILRNRYPFVPLMLYSAATSTTLIYHFLAQEVVKGHSINNYTRVPTKSDD